MVCREAAMSSSSRGSNSQRDALRSQRGALRALAQVPAKQIARSSGGTPPSSQSNTQGGRKRSLAPARVVPDPAPTRRAKTAGPVAAHKGKKRTAQDFEENDDTQDEVDGEGVEVQDAADSADDTHFDDDLRERLDAEGNEENRTPLPSDASIGSMPPSVVDFTPFFGVGRVSRLLRDTPRDVPRTDADRATDVLTVRLREFLLTKNGWPTRLQTDREMCIDLAAYNAEHRTNVLTSEINLGELHHGASMFRSYLRNNLYCL